MIEERINTGLLIQKHQDYFLKIWGECHSGYPEFDVKYSNKDQKNKETIFEHFIEQYKVINKSRSKTETIQPEKSATYTSITKGLFKTVFDYNDEELAIILSPEYKQVTKDFIKKSREFNPEIDLDDVFQACRNAWIMNGIQVMLGQKVELTPSIFAYSMLYPYSDNYLDNPLIDKYTKMAFSKRFYNRLAGIKVKPENKYEVDIFRLVEMIEEQFDRHTFPDVYGSLLAIHSAQTKSLNLLDKSINLTPEQILDICIEKGGTSVLADGYLVAGTLTEAQANFLYGFGVHLQLVDDIQDIKEDSNNGQLTIFSRVSEKIKVDEFTSRTFMFGNKVLDLMNCFNGSNLKTFKSLMDKSLQIMLVETIIINEEYFSKKYINHIKNYSPVSKTYIKKRRSKLSPKRISFMKKIMESTISNF